MTWTGALEQLRAALANGPDRDPEEPWPRSELIANAIRYGTQPVRVRLLHDPDRNLICEVSDGRSTSPHMRRAATTDEGGRGLFPVAQFAGRWGTRYNLRGKVIWTEQSLHDGGREPAPDVADHLLSQWDDDAW
ncbi:hypothetical protein T261_8229 [Streptomyces lydicus]|nr:hypothetical protein T261_8229 [Streptomyces lydicus]